jgi:adenylosuccinate lyase
MMILTGGALHHGAELTGNIQVNAAEMTANIKRAQDVILGEAAVFRLTECMSRAEAEDLVRKASRIAMSERTPLITVVRRLAHNAVVDWDSLAQPENYLGQTQEIIDAVLAAARSQSPLGR